MTPKPFLSFSLLFLSLSKIGQSNIIIQALENYLVYPAKNPTLLISGSVVTMTSLSQWNIFDIKYFSGGTIEHMMIINTLSVIQFLLMWRTNAKKEKSEVETEKVIDSRISEMQSEINSLKSRLVPH
jgi:hypothetical protein